MKDEEQKGLNKFLVALLVICLGFLGACGPNTKLKRSNAGLISNRRVYPGFDPSIGRRRIQLLTHERCSPE